MLTSQEFEPAFLSSVLHLPQLPFNPLPLKKFQIVWKPLCQSLLLPAYFLVFKFFNAAKCAAENFHRVLQLTNTNFGMLVRRCVG